MAPRFFLAVLLAISVALPAAAQSKKEKPKAAPSAAAPATGTNDDPVVARVNGQVIHRSEVELAYRGAPPQIQQAPFQQVYPQLLSSIINAELLAEAGRKAKIDQNARVKMQIAGATNEIVADAYVATLARSQITEAKLREAYDQYAKQAPQNEEIHARHILVGSEQEAKDLIDQLKKGADFATLANQKTTDPSNKGNGGDLGYFTKQDMVPDFANAAFALKPGEISQTPVHTQFGWHVIKVEDRRPLKPGTYEQVAPEIAQQMTRQIVGQKLQELRNEGKVEVFGPDGKALASAAPAPQPQQAAPAAAPAQPPAPAAAPTLSLPGGAAGSAPGAPKLSPATAPDQLTKP
jgi:peptidyl-prolyl cis-trans isomerase C